MFTPGRRKEIKNILIHIHPHNYLLSQCLEDIELSIALRKDKMSCTSHPIFYFISFDNCSTNFKILPYFYSQSLCVILLVRLCHMVIENYICQ